MTEPKDQQWANLNTIIDKFPQVPDPNDTTTADGACLYIFLNRVTHAQTASTAAVAPSVHFVDLGDITVEPEGGFDYITIMSSKTTGWKAGPTRLASGEGAKAADAIRVAAQRWMAARSAPPSQ